MRVAKARNEPRINHKYCQLQDLKLILSLELIEVERSPIQLKLGVDLNGYY